MTTSRKRAVTAGLVGGLLLAGLGLAVSAPAPRWLTSVTPVEIDLDHPDGLIDTESLGQLPRDVLAVPLFRDLLTEDLVTYYEQHPGRLTLAGILRRLAWEHDVDAGDWIIRAVLDEPAQVALWQARDGQIRHYLIVLRLNRLARMMELAARLALRDRFVREVAGGLPIGGTTVPAYTLERPAGRIVLFAAHADRLLIVSDAGMVVDREGKVSVRARRALDGLLGGPAPGYYLDRFALSPSGLRHRVVLAARYLSFGYQRFFPGLEAVRFDFGPAGWATRVLFDLRALPAVGFKPEQVWGLTPVDPSSCFALPVDWAAAATLAPSLGVDAADAAAAAEALEGPAAVCWYPRARLHAPVFVAPLKRPMTPDETTLLAAIFAAAIGRGDTDAPVDTVTADDGSLAWHRRVPHRLHRDAALETFDATLASHPRALVFSPDARLARDVLGVAARRYPAVADVLPAGGTVLAVVAAPSLATLFEMEIAAVPGAHEPAFRTVATTHLAPRLAALKRYPTYALVLSPAPGDPADRWTPVDWVELARP